MKILIIIRRYKGGVGNSSKRLAKALRKRGHIVEILSREDDFKIYSSIRSLLPLRRKIKQLVKEDGYNIIYTKDWGPAVTLLFPYPLFKKKHFCEFCGVETMENPKGVIFQKLIAFIMRKRLMVGSDYIKKYYPGARFICYRGINFEEFKPLNKKRKYIGWVKKSTEEIDEDFMKNLGKELNISYIIAESLTPEQMNEFYNKCKVFVSFPPERSGGGNVITEAMAAGVPIVISNDNCPRPNWPHYRVNEKDNKKKIEQILKIVKNPQPKIDFVSWLKKENFTWDATAERLEKFLSENIK